MNTLATLQTKPKIKLSDTFILLSTGLTTIGQVAAKRRAAQESVVAREDDYARRRRFRREVTDPFTANFYL